MIAFALLSIKHFMAERIKSISFHLLFILAVIVTVFSMSFINAGTNVHDGFTFGKYSGIIFMVTVSPLAFLMFYIASLIGCKSSILTMRSAYLIISLSVFSISIIRMMYYLVFSSYVHQNFGVPPAPWQNLVAIAISLLFYILFYRSKIIDG